MDNGSWSLLSPEDANQTSENTDSGYGALGQYEGSWPGNTYPEYHTLSMPMSGDYLFNDTIHESLDSGYAEGSVDEGTANHLLGQHLPDGDIAHDYSTLAQGPPPETREQQLIRLGFKYARSPSIVTALNSGIRPQLENNPQHFSFGVARGPQLTTPTDSVRHKADQRYTCCLCVAPSKSVTNSSASFKRHLSQKHSYTPQSFHCPKSSCSKVFLRRAHLVAHISRQHQERLEIADLQSTERREHHPSACPICKTSIQDWKDFYSCLKRHCLTDLKEESPPPRLSPSGGTVPASEPELEPEPLVERKRKRTSEEEPSIELMSPNDSQRQRLDDSCDRPADHTILSQQKQSSVSSELSPSASDSRDTDITRPEVEDDSIDSGIMGDRNLDHILDSSRYFGELDQLELATAQALGMETGPFIPINSLKCCIAHLRKWEAALVGLQSQGFCGPSMSLLVEKQDNGSIARTFPVSLKKVKWFLSGATHFGSSALDLWAKEWIRKMLNLSEADFSSLGPIDSMQILCSVLSIGLVSFSGSHVCPFDVNLWGQRLQNIPIGLGGYAFRPRKLACLDDFIGGPAWVLGKENAQETPNTSCIPQGVQSALPEDEEQVQQSRQENDGSLGQDPGMKVCLSVQEFDDLWGPISLVGGFSDRGLAIRTERGFILPLPHDQQPEPSAPPWRKQVIECHWTTEIPRHIFDGQIDGCDTGVPVSINATSRLLIGTDTETEIGLIVNEKCKSSIASIQQQIACRLQYPGTCKSKYVKDGFDLQFGGGQYITGGLVRKYKRMPKRTLKAMLIEDCKRPDTKLVPLLGLRAGLEVSACTGNAQRVTLWDALRLSQTGVQDLENPPYCAHKIGDRHCISSCWTRCHSNDDIDSFGDQPAYGSLLSGPQARRIIINSILALEHTGLDSEGNLQVAWPFSDIPAHCPVLPSTPKEANNWFRIVKETRETSSFPVFSQRCLEFHDKSLVRSCSAPCRTARLKPLQTILSTQILTLATNSPVLGLLEGARLLVGDAHLIVTKTVQGRVAIVATVSMNPLSPLRFRLREILPDAPAHGFKENIRPGISVGLSVPVYVH